MSGLAAESVSVTLPPGRTVELPGRGTTFVRELPGPPGAPVVLLLHGWTATSDLNWFNVYDPLAEHYRVIALDHRGHGRGIRTPEPFRLDDCADDAAAVCEALGVTQVIPIGYSMGGPVGQLMWRRHPELITGLVLCATSATFNTTTRERAMFSAVRGVATLSRLAPPPLRAMTALRIITGRGDRDLRQWAYGEVARHDWLRIVQAGREIGRFDARRWIRNLDVPCAIVITLDDEIVPTPRQLALAGTIPTATLHEVPGGHTSCINHPQLFVPALLAACDSVVARQPLSRR